MGNLTDIEKEMARISARPHGLRMRTVGQQLNGEVAKFAEKHGIRFDQAVDAFASGNPEIYVIHLEKD